MAKTKKEKDDVAPNANNVPNRDIIQRLNFLYQASVLLNGLPESGHASSTFFASQPDEKPPQRSQGADTEASNPELLPPRRPKRTVNAHDLSRTYVRAMKIIGQKTNVRMDPSVKRTLCKTCDLVLLPGTTAIVRVKHLPSHRYAVTYGCIHCGTLRRIPAPPVAGGDFFPPPTRKSDVLKGNAAIEDANISVVVASASTATPTAGQKNGRGRKRNRRNRMSRPPPFCEREDHTVFAGNNRFGGSVDTP